MSDYLAPVENLRKAAAETALVRDRAIDGATREMYARVHDNLNRSADEVEQVMKGLAGPEGDDLEKIASNMLTPNISSPTNVPVGPEFEK